MPETLNIGAGRPPGDIPAPDLKPTRGRAVERRGNREGPAFVNTVRGDAPSVRKLARSVAAIGNQAQASQRADKALASAQRRVEQLHQLALAQRDGTPSPNEQIETAALFSAAEHDLAAIVESIPSLAGDLLPALGLGGESDLAATISQLQAAGERIVAERSAVETRRADARRAADSLAAEPGAIDEVSARELVDITRRQIELNQEAALNSHASSIVQAAIRAFS